MSAQRELENLVATYATKADHNDWKRQNDNDMVAMRWIITHGQEVLDLLAKVAAVLPSLPDAETCCGCPVWNGPIEPPDCCASPINPRAELAEALRPLTE